MNWPLITRARHLRELDAQQRGYELMFEQIGGTHAALRKRIADLETVAVDQSETGTAIACLEDELTAAKKHAAQLQARLDDAVGLGASRPQDSRYWQSGYVEPKPDPKPEVAS